jgi:DNA ligase-1
MSAASFTPFRPLLAADAGDLDKLRYPLLASFKIDGVRALVTPAGARSRSMKRFASKHICAMLDALPSGLDGEIGVINERGVVDFRATTSAIKTRGGNPSFQFFVFDNYLSGEDYVDRYEALPRGLPDWVKIVPQREVTKPSDVLAMFAEALEKGFEGLVLRDANAPYKFGRSTQAEAYLLKLKPWGDAEAYIVDVLPEEGRARAGKLVVRNPYWTKPFEIGGGFTDADKASLWRDREKLVGQVARFRFVPVGGYDVPRHCQFDGLRALEDL